MLRRIAVLASLTAALGLASACASAPPKEDPTPAPAPAADPAPPAEPTPPASTATPAKVAPAQGDVFGGAVKLDDNTDAFAVEGTSAEVQPQATPKTETPVKVASPAASAELVIGAPLVSGPMERAEVQNRIDRQQKALQGCFKAHIDAQGAAGNMIVSFTIKPAGTPEQLKIAKSSLGKPEIDTCVTQVLNKVVYPNRKDSAAVTVQLPLLLTAPAP